MVCGLVPVRPDEIDWRDLRFEIPALVPARELEESVRRHGCLEPPRVLSGDGTGYTVVDGFKRLRFLLATASNEAVPCLVYPKGMDFAELFRGRIELLCLRGTPNPAETACIVQKLHEIPVEAEVLFRMMRRLGLAPKPDVAADWRRLASSGEKLLAAAASGTVSARTALQLAGWEKEEGAGMLDVLSELRCSVSVQAEMLDRVTAVAAMSGVGRLEVLNCREVLDITRVPGKSPREKCDTLRRFLYHKQYPRLRAREARFEREAAEADLPSGMRIIPPPAFEGDRWRIELTFSSEPELSKHLEVVQRLMSSGTLGALRAGLPMRDGGESAGVSE